MAYYSRARLVLESSDTSDYAKAKFDETEQTNATSTQRRYEDVVEVDTGGTTYALGHLATCKWIKIHNPSSNSYKVTATLRTTANGATTFTVDINTGETLWMPDLRASGGAVQDITLTSTTASQKVRVAFEGT